MEVEYFPGHICDALPDGIRHFIQQLHPGMPSDLDAPKDRIIYREDILVENISAEKHSSQPTDRSYYWPHRICVCHADTFLPLECHQSYR